MFTAKCEWCGKEISSGHKNEWPEGWIKTGTSRWDRMFEKAGIAWWCPDHQDKVELYTDDVLSIFMENDRLREMIRQITIAVENLDSGYVAPEYALGRRWAKIELVKILNS